MGEEFNIPVLVMRCCSSLKNYRIVEFMGFQDNVFLRMKDLPGITSINEDLTSHQDRDSDKTGIMPRLM